MRQPIFLVLFFGLIAGSAFADDRKAAAQPNNSREGFTTLFNGKDFTGWHGLKTMDPRQLEALSADEKSKVLAEGAEDMKKHWKVQDGVIVNDGQGVYLTTDKDFGDIELLVDWKIGPQGDSGVYLRDAAGSDLGFHRAPIRVDGRRQGLRRSVEQQPGHARERSLGPRR